MPLYLSRFSYSTDAIKALVSNPQDREQAGALTKFETTVLLGMDEAQEAMRKAGAAAHRPPS